MALDGQTLTLTWLPSINNLSQADDLAAVFQYPFNPQSQDFFNYYGEVKKLVRRVHDLNARLPVECCITLPDTIVRALLRAMRVVPLYKTVLDSVIIKNPDEWKTFSADDLYKHLEQVNSNNRGVSKVSISVSTAGRVCACQHGESAKRQKCLLFFS